MKKHLWLYLRILIAVGIIALLFSTVERDKFLETLRHFNVPRYAGALLLYILVVILGSVRLQVLLKVQNVTLGLKKIFRLFFIGLFFNNVMPGLVGGDLVKAYYLSKETHDKKTEAVTTVFIDRIIGTISLFSIGVCALLWLKIAAFKNLERILIAGLCIFIALAFLFMHKSLLKKLPYVETLMKKLPSHEILRKIYNAYSIYKSNLLALLRAFVLTILLQVIMIFIVYLTGTALAIEAASLKHYFIFFPVATIISAIPVTPAGWGIGEAAYSKLFAMVNVPEAKALALALMARGVLLLWGLIGGLFYVTYKKGAPGKLQKEELRDFIEHA